MLPHLLVFVTALATGARAQAGVPSAATDIIKKFEGFSSSAYPDPGTGAAPWTIGYGTTQYCNGTKVKLGDTVSMAQASQELSCNLQGYVQIMSARIPTWSFMNDCQKSAILSFGYNLGPRFYSTRQEDCCPSISKALSTRANWPDEPAKLQLYTSAGGQKMAGLVRRRNAEAALWKSASC